VREVGRVEEIERVRAERVAFLGPADAFAREIRAREPGLGDRVAQASELRAQPIDVRGPSGAVGALDHDEPARQLPGREPGKRAAVSLKLPHTIPSRAGVRPGAARWRGAGSAAAIRPAWWHPSRRVRTRARDSRTRRGCATERRGTTAADRARGRGPCRLRRT